MKKKPSLNRNLHAAKASKQDEFYTQLADIEKELRHYAGHFAGKTVLCNCDDPRVSNFFRYFLDHFERRRVVRLSRRQERRTHARAAMGAVRPSLAPPPRQAFSPPPGIDLPIRYISTVELHDHHLE